MQKSEIYATMTHWQNQLYSELNNFSNSHTFLGRLGAIPVSLLDVGLDTFKTPLSVIEYVAKAAMNLLGAIFSTIGIEVEGEYTLKQSLANVESALLAIAHTPIKLSLAPIKIAFQFFAILINPKNVQSIDYSKPTFSSRYAIFG